MRKRKLFYVPGLVSLIGLPILLLFWGPREQIWQTMVTIRMPSDDAKPDPHLMLFSKWLVYHDLRHTNIISVDLDFNRFYRGEMPDQFCYQKEREFISNEIARRQFTQDTNSVLKIAFGPHCTYGDFVWLLNLVKIYDVRRYVFIDNAFFLFTNPAPEPHGQIDIQPAFTNDVVYVPTGTVNKPTGWEILKERMQKWFDDAYSIVKESFAYVLGFFLLILVPAVAALSKKILLNRKKTAIFRET